MFARSRSWLSRVSKDVWVLFLLKLLESYAYFVTSLNLTLYMSDNFGFTDTQAGAVYATWGVAAAIAGTVAGPLIDKLGVRTSLIVGSVVSLIGRAVFAHSRNSTHALVALYVIQSFGLALGIPVLSIGIRRVVPDLQTQATAFGLFYSCMNVGALAAGWVTDAINHNIAPNHPAISLTYIMWTPVAATAANVLIACTLFRISTDIQVDERAPTLSYASVKRTCTDKIFWQLCAFSAALFGARSIFRHVDATMPKWLQRTVSEHVNYGFIYSINPMIIIFLVPLIQHRLAAYDGYDTVTFGTTIIFAAPMLLAVATPSYAAADLFMVIVSVGEAVYSPRSMQYVLHLAPKGGEGVYGVLAAVPLFGVKFVTGLFSGHLLDTYCPDGGPDHCRTMWLYIAFGALSSVFLLIVLRPWARVPTGKGPTGPLPREEESDTEVLEDIDVFDPEVADVLNDAHLPQRRE